MAGCKIRGFLLFLLLFAVTGCGDLETGLASLTISPSSVTVGVTQTQLFTVIGKDSLGMIVEVSPIWSVSGSIGDISSTGLFEAGSSSGEGTVTASYGSKTASATVSVTKNGWLEGRIQSSFGYSSGIKIYLSENTSLLDFSDSDGYYSISDIPAGTYEALTEATAVFQAASQEVSIEEGERTTWNILLQTQPGVPSVPTTTLPPF